MCIRDSSYTQRIDAMKIKNIRSYLKKMALTKPYTIAYNTCLLYTSDAADERSSVDLGGRRIIKKK